MLYLQGYRSVTSVKLSRSVGLVTLPANFACKPGLSFNPLARVTLAVGLPYLLEKRALEWRGTVTKSWCWSGSLDEKGAQIGGVGQLSEAKARHKRGLVGERNLYPDAPTGVERSNYSTSQSTNLSPPLLESVQLKLRNTCKNEPMSAHTYLCTHGKSIELH